MMNNCQVRLLGEGDTVTCASLPNEVPAIPIYIQEKIHPQAIIKDFRHQIHLSFFYW